MAWEVWQEMVQWAEWSTKLQWCTNEISSQWPGKCSENTAIYITIRELNVSLYIIHQTFLATICCRPSVCLSVTLVHRTQAVEIFCNISTAFGTLAIRWHPWKKIYGNPPRGTPPPGELNTRGVAKYSDFGPIEGYMYISETVQDRK